MNKIVFVNATAATEGGALTILKQFLETIFKSSSNNTIYYIFCSLEELKVYESKNIEIVSNVKGKKWLDRIKWDLWGLKTWGKKEDIRADLVISFQNTGVKYYSDVAQLIYLHQSIPFSEDINWNFFNKNERVLWFYKNIYKRLIKITLKKNFVIVVQAGWMREAVIQQFKWNPAQVIVSKPNTGRISIEEVESLKFKNNKFHIFYPANHAIYKNHELIIKSLEYVKHTKPEVYNNIIIHFTFNKNLSDNRNAELVNLVKKMQVIDCVRFEGKISYERVLSFYKSCDLMIFPSYIETFGLPLIEAASFGMPILVSDLDYAREVISDYEGVKFLDHKDSKLWAENIVGLYNKRLKYKPCTINYETPWKDFFNLIEKLTE